MKHLLALLLLSCVLVAQDKPAAVYGEIDVPMPAVAVKLAVAAPIPPVNVRDELIELVHLLKADAGAFVRPPTITLLDPSLQASLSAGYDARMKAKTEAQRLLLQALIELSKLTVDSPPHLHSSSAELKDAPLKRGSRTR